MKEKVIRKSLAILTVAGLAVSFPLNAFAQENEIEEFLEEDIIEEEVVEEAPEYEFLPEEEVISIDEIEDYEITEDITEAEDADSEEFMDAGDEEVIEYTLGETVNDTVEKYKYKVYGFTLKKAARVNIHTVSGGNYWILATKALFGDDFYEVDDCKFWQFPTDQTTYKGTDDNHVDLIPGDYYLYAISGSTHLPDEIKYSFTMTFDEIVVGKDEEAVFDKTLDGSNNDEEIAEKIKTDQKYVAQSHSFYMKDSVAPKDWFVFTLDKDSRMYLTATNDQIDQLNFRFYTYDTKNRSTTLISTQPCPLELTAGYYYSGEQICKFADLWDPGEDTIFKKGTYAMSVEKIRDTGSRFSVGNTGEYRFMISTKTAIPVESITLQRNGAAVANIKLPLNKTAELTAVVKPDKATEKGVIWSSDDESVAVVKDGVITPKSIGECTITATTIGLNSKKEALSAKCQVEVTQEKVQKEIPIVIAKQKVDLSGEDFFNEPYNKTDKYVVTPKNMGSVSKGKFTGKKAGEVTITKKVKDGKQYVETDTIKVEIEVPVIKYPEKAKAFDIYAPLQGIVLDKLIVCEKSGELPVKYVAADKKGSKYELGTDGRTLNIYKSGKAKVTAYYGEGKDAAAYAINFNVKLPKLSKSKVTVKKGKSVAVKISNVQKDLTPKWAVMAYDEVNEEWDSTGCAVAEAVEGSNGLKCKVYGLEKTGNYPVYLIAEVDGYIYLCPVYVK